MDLVTNLGPPGGQKHHILAAIDCYSKFCVLTTIPDKSAKTVAQVMQDKVFACYGKPMVLRSD